MEDPLQRQFIPLRSSLVDTHPKLALDSMNKVGNSPVPGAVHKYSVKAPKFFSGCPLNSPSGKKHISVPDLPSILSSQHKIEGIFNISQGIYLGA